MSLIRTSTTTTTQLPLGFPRSGEPEPTGWGIYVVAALVVQGAIFLLGCFCHKWIQDWLDREEGPRQRIPLSPRKRPSKVFASNLPSLIVARAWERLCWAALHKEGRRAAIDLRNKTFGRLGPLLKRHPWAIALRQATKHPVWRVGKIKRWLPGPR